MFAEDRGPANLALRSLLSSAVVDWRYGRCSCNEHGGESRLKYGMAVEENPGEGQA